MTDKDLQLLAQRFAEENPPIGVKDEVLKVNAIELNAEMFYNFLKWLSSRYCLVEKSKLEALQDEIHGEIMCAHDDDDWQSAAHYILDVMPRSFKELFTDTKQ